MKYTLYTGAFVAAALLLSCDAAKTVSSEVTEEISEEIEDVGSELAPMETVDLSYMNTSVRPQDDFFEFSNGTWIKENPVPPSESRWGSFNELQDSNNEKLKAILEEASKNASSGDEVDRIIGNYYMAYMDMESRNAKGLTPIMGELERIDKMNSKKDLVNVIAKHHVDGIGSLFGFGVGQDLKDVDNTISYFGQGGIGLPNRDYYFAKDKAEILEKYQKHISSIMNRFKMEDRQSSEFAISVVGFETKLAENMLPPAEMRIPEKTYNKYGKKQFIQEAGRFDMASYLQGIGSQSFDSLIVGQPEFLAGIAKLITDAPLDEWKNYLKWKVIDHYAGHLDEKMVQLNFDFYGVVLRGKKERKEMYKEGIDAITGSPFSEVLGRAFVEKHYSESAKDRVNTMVDNLLTVFQGRINNLEWMSQETKDQALIKLNAIGRKLGYPSKWEDFSSLQFSKDNYLANVTAAAHYAHKKNMAELNKPVDKEEWGMPAHMVNAYYHPLLNEIAFPAGIMQAPFFSDSYEDAVNYGRIGMVIGHEFTHGFDDMGSKFAADGSFMNWWTESDRKLFEERTEKLGNTYSGFCPIDGHCVNPDLTMGENLSLIHI